MNNLLKSYIKAVFVCTFVTTLFACETKSEDAVATETIEEKSETNNQITLTDKQSESIGFEFGGVKIETVSDVVKASGRVDLPPVNLATVSLPIAGKVKTLRGLPGQAVKKGEVLATLESFEFIQIQQDYLQNYSQMGFQEKDMERQKSLNSENVGARKNYEQAIANFNSTQALIQSLEAKLNILGISGASLRANGVVSTVKVTSPVNGFITSTSVNLGKDIAAGQSIFEIVDKSHLHFELTIFEKDAPKIKEGQSVEVLVNGTSTPIPARVKLVGKILEGESRSMLVHAHAINKSDEAKLVPGSFINAEISIGNREAKMVPAVSIVRKGAMGFMYTSGEKNQFLRVPVEIGSAKKGDWVEVGLTDETDVNKIVTKGAFQLDAEFVKRSDAGEE